jgi:hypothetical protein
MEATHPGTGFGEMTLAGGYARGHTRPRSKAWLAIVVGVVAVATATVAMWRGIEPFATSYYIFAWYATLLILYGALALTSARSPALRRPLSLATMLGWSVVVWLFFELLNFRLLNWYYVFVPADAAIRWVAITISFATVLPAIFGAEALLEGLGAMENVRWPKLSVTERLLRNMRIAGVLMLILPMIWPRFTFPLVWGTATFMLEPSVYRRDRTRSLLCDLEQGKPGRLLRILLGGAAIGFLWELFNIKARGKWIYTVPFFDELKLFEMPVLGFLGFPPFSVDCFVIWQMLVLLGIAVPLSGRALPAPAGRRWGAAAAAVAFSVAVLAVMELRTISSYTPRLRDMPGVPAAELRRAGLDVFSLAESEPEHTAVVAGATTEQAQSWIDRARLVGLRGIGTHNAERLMQVCVYSVEDLSRRDPEQLAKELREKFGKDFVYSRVTLWVRAAKRATRDGEGTGLPTREAGACAQGNQLTTSSVPDFPSMTSPITAAGNSFRRAPTS